MEVPGQGAGGLVVFRVIAKLPVVEITQTYTLDHCMGRNKSLKLCNGHHSTAGTHWLSPSSVPGCLLSPLTPTTTFRVGDDGVPAVKGETSDSQVSNVATLGLSSGSWAVSKSSF